MRPRGRRVGPHAVRTDVAEQIGAGSDAPKRIGARKRAVRRARSGSARRRAPTSARTRPWRLRGVPTSVSWSCSAAITSVSTIVVVSPGSASWTVTPTTAPVSGSHRVLRPADGSSRRWTTHDGAALRPAAPTVPAPCRSTDMLFHLRMPRNGRASHERETDRRRQEPRLPGPVFVYRVIQRECGLKTVRNRECQGSRRGDLGWTVGFTRIVSMVTVRQ